MDIVIYEGKRADTFNHSDFTTNPRASSDEIELRRYRKKPGEPERNLVKTGPVFWEFPSVEQ